MRRYYPRPKLSSSELIDLGLRAVETLCFDWGYCPADIPRYYWRSPETIVQIPDFQQPRAIQGCLSVLRRRYELPGLFVYAFHRSHFEHVGYNLDPDLPVWWAVLDSNTCRVCYGNDGSLIPPPIRSLFGGPARSAPGAIVDGLEKWTRLYSPERARAYQDKRREILGGDVLFEQFRRRSSASTPGRYHRPPETEE